MQILELENVAKSFGKLEAVKDLSLAVPPGTMYGFLGPNGAGKTTTIRMIMEIILPDHGEILINGQPNTSREILDRVGYLPEERGVYRKMKVREALEFFAELKGMKKRDYAPQINVWLERFEMTEVQNKKMEELSKGNQQKVQFLTTVLHAPDLIILDEPFMGLDPLNANLVKDVMLEQKARGASIVFSTHQMDAAEKLCDAICLINKGQKVLDGELKSIKRNFGRNNVILAYDGKSDFLKNNELVERCDDYGNYVEVHLRDGVNPQALLAAAMQQAEISRFEVVEPSLHEIFIATVKEN
ncbi:MAG: ATP-binding cassette domain-containing protein [candidate division KSB1 bacterium]|nr:ATP-binding cassette domain-containing protein [candidate division KSB1 bacterium]MDZ7301483.1 ATP-binding cassette domain-containing protein [candidate division KSB1 bacterium]MDZ7310885.1 ATP-binding cassette domain-containing protein [candidate division KSB1 bacterium]